MKRNLLQTLMLAWLCLLPALAWADPKYNLKVLRAFKPIVEQTSSSTVRIFVDQRRAALGTVVDAEGYIFTKASELKGTLEAQAYDGTRVPAKIIGIDRKLDLAMLKVDLPNLKPIAWGNESDSILGSWLITPGLDTVPVAVGVMSATKRNIPRAQGALGVALQPVSGGAIVQMVMPNKAADKVGMQPGDVITQVGEKTVKSLEEVQKEIFSYEPNEEVIVVIKRGAETLRLHVTLGSKELLMQGERAEFQNQLGSELSKRRAGFPLVIQHDSVLQPTDCGGPLVNLEGKAIGINIARAGRVESFALAASVIQPLIADFKAGKYAPADLKKASEVLSPVVQTSTTATPMSEPKK
jgi:serine protease Do